MTTFTPLPDPSTPLSRESARAAFADILDARASEEDIGAFLLALSDREETSLEIAEAARALRERMIPIDAPAGAIDVCGTGGDGHHTLNVSTAVALVVASCGVPVAKHGNRAASSKAGAADTLEALGLDLDIAGATAEGSLADLGIAFLFAANHHPAMKRITPIRHRIGKRTIFNLMGPLANPARVTRQLLGIARPDYAGLYAEALAQLGTEAAAVISGEEGLDELSTAGPSLAVTIGTVALPARIVPEDAGLARHSLAALRLKSRLIGVNNRNLHDFSVDFRRTYALVDKAPPGCTFVAESGLSSRADLDALAEHGVHCFLIGESLMRQPDLTAATRALVG